MAQGGLPAVASRFLMGRRLNRAAAAAGLADAMKRAARSAVPASVSSSSLSALAIRSAFGAVNPVS